MKMKDETPSFLAGKGNIDYFSELIEKKSKEEMEEIYQVLIEIESYLNSSLVNPIVDLKIEDVIQNKKIINFLKYEVSFIKENKKTFLLVPGSEGVIYLNRFKKKIEQKYPELLARNAKLFLKEDGKVEYLSPSGSIYIQRFKPRTSSYKLLKYLITSSKIFRPVSYEELGKALGILDDSARTEIRTINDAVTYVRKRMGIKANSQDDIFLAGNGFALRISGIFK